MYGTGRFLSVRMPHVRTERQPFRFANDSEVILIFWPDLRLESPSIPASPGPLRHGTWKPLQANDAEDSLATFKSILDERGAPTASSAAAHVPLIGRTTRWGMEEQGLQSKASHRPKADTALATVCCKADFALQAVGILHNSESKATLCCEEQGIWVGASGHVDPF